VDVNASVGRGKDISARIICDQAIVERPIYFNKGGRDGGHTAVGF
jgi:hypothetical protein